MQSSMNGMRFQASVTTISSLVCGKKKKKKKKLVKRRMNDTILENKRLEHDGSGLIVNNWLENN